MELQEITLVQGTQPVVVAATANLPVAGGNHTGTPAGAY
jgi:hypothetical protein